MSLDEIYEQIYDDEEDKASFDVIEANEAGLTAYDRLMTKMKENQATARELLA